ncbi:type II 3-dehydroquinate dehydratase [Leucobacter weissii]|uniref:3-dehydroquinate dehydratase n=1 Tax=Leucobacter weissii TaxID=1983706 RepID=A0A939SAF8_9MICO|nr:type II 3-dehydroquinate dehydratase [Leucobacter weissii]MBO1900430.1 type II 3-dehydroquinate dehydratase [Leucobacter weissii]
MSERVLVLHGPNLNLLGTREPHIYGTLTQDEIVAETSAAAEPLGIRIDLLQSNHEGALIDALHAAPQQYDGVILNPSALTHTSIALRDAVGAIPTPVIEVHLSNVHAREPYRKVSYVADRVAATVSGAGAGGYVAAVVLLARIFAERGEGSGA